MNAAHAWTVDGTPVPQGSLRRGGRGQVFYTNDHWLMAWRKTIAAACPITTPEPGPWRVCMQFRVVRPPSVKRELPCVMPDLDKYIRAVFDALTGLVWFDDGQVVEVKASKRYSEQAGVTIMVDRV